MICWDQRKWNKIIKAKRNIIEKECSKVKLSLQYAAKELPPKKCRGINEGG